jgi:hypothetical protein
VGLPLAELVTCAIAASGSAQEASIDRPAGLRLAMEDHPSAADCDRIALNFDRYNRKFLGETGYSQIAIFIRDEPGKIRAGLVGSVNAGWR